VRHRQSYYHRRRDEQADRDAAGLLSARYVGVSCIEFRITYYQRAANPVLMERTLRFFPGSWARFFVRCEHFGCTGGGYDLEPVVDRLVRSRKSAARGRLFCHGSDGTIGHGSIAYEITVAYDGAARRAKRI
jgi:hypothetical protein